MGGSLEDAAAEAFPFLLDALGIAALGLLVPNRLALEWRFGAQLTLLSLFSVFLAYRLLHQSDQVWFGGRSLRLGQRLFGTALGVIVIVTGVVALATLASSAALRFEASTQFFQLVSALDIAWAVSTVMVAAHWLWGRRAALVGGLAVVAVCLWAVRRYIVLVGFGAKGGWRVRGDSLFELVIIYDMAVAALAIGLLVFAIRRRAARAGLLPAAAS